MIFIWSTMIRYSTPERRSSASTTAGRDGWEYTAKDNAYSYVESGDLKLDRRLTHTGQFVLPCRIIMGSPLLLILQRRHSLFPERSRDSR